MNRKVLIENRGYTSHKNAEHYVRQGRARWIKAAKPTIRFIETDHRHRVVLKHAGDMYIAGRDGLARIDQVRRIPVVGGVRRLFTLMGRARRAR